MITDKYDKKWYKVALHLHTTRTDGHLSLDEVAVHYKKSGFDVIAITDHWLYTDKCEVCGMKIMSGCEYNLGGSDTSVDVMHIVGVGMGKKPDITDKNAPRQAVIDKINETDGVAILAHPAWSLNTIADIKPLQGFSMVEIYNSVSDAHQSNRPYSGYIVDVMANNGIIIPLAATDDAHYYDGSDDVKSFVMVNSESDDVDDILDAIKRQKFYSSQGPELYVRREGERIVVECSPCEKIVFVSNSAWAPDRTVRGEQLTQAEYQIKDYEKWVRVEVTDKNGLYAWSNIIPL